MEQIWAVVCMETAINPEASSTRADPGPHAVSLSHMLHHKSSHPPPPVLPHIINIKREYLCTKYIYYTRIIHKYADVSITGFSWISPLKYVDKSML